MTFRRYSALPFCRLRPRGPNVVSLRGVIFTQTDTPASSINGISRQVTARGGLRAAALVVEVVDLDRAVRAPPRVPCGAEQAFK